MLLKINSKLILINTNNDVLNEYLLYAMRSLPLARYSQIIIDPLLLNFLLLRLMILF